MDQKTKENWKRIFKILTVIGLAACAVFVIYGWKKGLFASKEAMEEFLKPYGGWAPLLFVVIQIVQVVVPIIPGGVSCLAGVLLFGPLPGFLYNYIGICIGSVLAFLISRRLGMEAVQVIADQKAYGKYVKWLDSDKFDKLFALAIFAPVAPDDLLCYLAGVTKMKLKKFTAIILLGKPLAIAAYSFCLNLAANSLFSWVLR